MIFPYLKNKTFGYVNLDKEALLFISEKKIKNTKKSIFLKPQNGNLLINYINKKYNLDYSYGGWMEDRSNLLKGSYLEKESNFIHLGVDINVPVNTKVAVTFNSLVVKIDDDNTLDAGWGPRVIVKNLNNNLYFIYSHLNKKITCKEGQVLKKGHILGKIGNYPLNGNWFPHLHLQTISEKYYKYLEKNNLISKLDGYGNKKNIKESSLKHKDPLNYISLI